MSRLMVLKDKIVVVLNTIDKTEDFGDILWEGCAGLWNIYSKYVYDNYQKSRKIIFPELHIADEYMSNDTRRLNNVYDREFTEDEIKSFHAEGIARLLMQIEYAKELVKVIDGNHDLLLARNAKDYLSRLKRACKGVPSFSDLEEYEGILDVEEYLGVDKFGSLVDELSEYTGLYELPVSGDVFGVCLVYDEKEGMKFKD